jgi:hypothetical protein
VPLNAPHRFGPAQGQMRFRGEPQKKNPPRDS